MNDQTLAALNAEIDGARSELRKVEADVRAAEREALSRVREEYAERLQKIRARLRQAQVRKDTHLDATATHEWEGRRVVRTVRCGWAGQRVAAQYGVVQVRRKGMEFPENVTWGVPRIGEAFVRLELKSGKLGKRFDALRSNWQLVEDAA